MLDDRHIITLSLVEHTSNIIAWHL